MCALSQKSFFLFPFSVASVDEAKLPKLPCLSSSKANRYSKHLKSAYHQSGWIRIFNTASPPFPVQSTIKGDSYYASASCEEHLVRADDVAVVTFHQHEKYSTKKNNFLATYSFLRFLSHLSPHCLLLRPCRASAPRRSGKRWCTMQKMVGQRMGLFVPPAMNAAQ